MSYILIICAAVYATLAALIAIQARHRTNFVLAVCCGVTAVWAACGFFRIQPSLEGAAGLLDLIRLLIWYVYLLHLYKWSGVGSRLQIRGFSMIAVAVFAAGVAVACTSNGSLTYTLTSAPISIRLLLCICELLLIENLYLNLPEGARWHVALPCVLLGGLACFDILVVADAALFRRPSIPLASGRAIAMIVVAPLLILAALRGQRWSEPVRLSRAAVFHSATLVLSGSVLLALALAGEILRHLDETWGWVAELILVFSGLIGILLFLSSRSARSLMDRVVVHHFFADRFDYRIQWLNCIRTLSGKNSNEQTDLHTRAIRAVADVVNSPNGALFLRRDLAGTMAWESSWNMPAVTNFQSLHLLIQLMSSDHRVIDLRQARHDFSHVDCLGQLGPIWLAVPLLHSNGIIGLIVLGPPRTAFRVDQEVFDLLGILGQEVGTYIAEQRAAKVVIQTRSLHEYGTRFAFVAHDIKNVSSQLALLLCNAQKHLENPAFQRDMLQTVRSSVEKIDRLLKRLDEPDVNVAPASIIPIYRLQLLLANSQRVPEVVLDSKYADVPARIAIGPEAFDTAVTHLLNNAFEAAPTHAVVIKVEDEAERVIIDITDHGEGMSAEFIRDELFSPFKTKKPGGSGIGAFQARELIKEGGGEILVISQQGVGTTMRLMFKRVDEAGYTLPGEFSLSVVGN